MLFAFPMSTDVVNPALRDSIMLTANLAVCLLLAPVAGHNPVKRSCIFCIKIWPASIPYSFFCWANPWRWFTFRHLCWVYQVIQPHWIICTCIIRFTFKPLIDIDFSVTFRSFTWQLFETTKLPYDINIDFSRRLPPNYHKKWLLTKKKR